MYFTGRCTRSGLNGDNYPLVACEGRLAAVGHGQDDVHRFRLGDFRSRAPGVDARRIFDLERRTSAAAREEERARLAIVEPLVGKRVAVGIAGPFSAQVDPIAGLCGERFGVFEPGDWRVVRLGEGLMVQSMRAAKSF